MDIRRDIETGLSNVGVSYLETGLQVFHKVRNANFYEFQHSIGNISIGIELLLKCLIANKCFVHLFSNLTLDMQVKLSSDDVRKRNPLTNIEETQMKYFLLNSQELNKCVSIFYTIFPKQKQDFKPYFKLLLDVRNIAVHGAFPKFQKYDMERIAFVAIKLFELLKKEQIGHLKFSSLTEQDYTFYKNYDAQRIERVRVAIENAKTKAKEIEHWSFIDVDDWDVLTTKCPICKCDGILYGSTDYGTEYEKDGGFEYLSFAADSFKCDECGLELLDHKELKLVNMDTAYDRGRDLVKWKIEKGMVE